MLRGAGQRSYPAGQIASCDVMDGHFVPNLTFGPLVVAALKPICSDAKIPLDVHLMVEKPEALISSFASAAPIQSLFM